MRTRKDFPGSSVAEQLELACTIESARTKLRERSESVPCHLRDVRLCVHSSPETCAQGGSADCPLVQKLKKGARDVEKRLDAEHALVPRAETLGIPTKHWHLIGIPGYDGPRFRKTEALAAIEYDATLPGVRSVDTILVLCGDTGIGKSGAAARWLWRQKCTGAWKQSGEVQRMSWFEKGAVDGLIAKPALVIDELGTEVDDSAGNWRSKLDQVITGRYDHDRPTLITTNLREPYAKKLLGERICDRIEEGGRIVECRGESIRGEKKQQQKLDLPVPQGPRR